MRSKEQDRSLMHARTRLNSAVKYLNERIKDKDRKSMFLDSTLWMIEDALHILKQANDNERKGA